MDHAVIAVDGCRQAAWLRKDRVTEKRYVQCGTHGEVEPAFVCQHLLGACGDAPTAVGWFEAEIDPDNREWGDQNGWCAACDEVLSEEGEWNDRSEGFAQIKLVCEFCFARMRDVQQGLVRSKPSLWARIRRLGR